MREHRETDRAGRRRPPLHLLTAAAMCLLLAAAGFAALHLGVPHQDLLDVRDDRVLAEGWTDAAGAAVTLPDFPDHRSGAVCTYTLRLPEDGPPPRAPVLWFTARYLNARFYLDGVPLGESLARPAGAADTQGTVFTLLPLPADYAGRELKIEVELLLGERVSYEVPAPHLGSRGGIVSAILRGGLPSVLVDVFIFCFSVILLLFGLQRGPVRQERTFLYTGLFALCFALYSLCTSNVLHLVCTDSYFIYVFEFLLLALLPIPLAAAFAERCRPPYRQLLRADLALLTGNLFLQAGLHFLTPLEVRSTVFLTHSAMVVSLAVMVPSLLRGWDGRSRRQMAVIFSPVLAGALADLALFYGTRYFRDSFWVKIGVMVFILLQTYSLVRDYLEHYESDLKADVYRRMAYVDALTGLGNRASFERRIAELERELPALASLWCVSADVNSLKQVNDTRGHAAGDELIRGAADLLRGALSPACSVYRTGGDEFVAFLTDQPEEAVRRRLDRVVRAQEAYRQTHGIDLSIALGCDRFRFDGADTVSELISRADARMYEEKRLAKKRRAAPEEAGPPRP